MDNNCKITPITRTSESCTNWSEKRSTKAKEAISSSRKTTSSRCEHHRRHTWLSLTALNSFVFYLKQINNNLHIVFIIEYMFIYICYYFYFWIYVQSFNLFMRRESRIKCRTKRSFLLLNTIFQFVNTFIVTESQINEWFSDRKN